MAIIHLTQGYVTQVDDADYEWLSQWKWQINTKRYAGRHTVSKGVRRFMFMHRVIADASHGIEVDHIDRDTLNNQRSNLRLATRSQNTANMPSRANSSSRFKGVSWENRRGIWRAAIQINGRRIKLGTFQDEVKAALAYDTAARKYHGEFAFANFEEGFTP